MDTSYLTLPEKFLEKVPLFIPEEKISSVLQTFTRKRLPSFRVNTLKTSLTAVEKQLTDKEFVLEKVLWNPDAFVLTNKSIQELMDTAPYNNGEIYIQNLSSMIPALVLNLQPTDRVLDMAAAPGSKTTQIAALMGNNGEIVGNDISKERLYKLKHNLTEQGVTNTIIKSIPGEFIWKRYPEYFDKVLLDAPCSMEGLFDSNNPKTYTHWTQRKVKDLAIKQTHLLRSAISATIPGGTIVYSTCTLSPEENEAVIDWMLKKEGDAISLESIEIPHLSLDSGITNWKKGLSSELTKTARIWPTDTMEGFFIAKLRKNTSTIPTDFRM
ncbi:RsmB/NOP family class I SAM-dependent RNA methyltransferase [soil metagenome]